MIGSSATARCRTFVGRGAGRRRSSSLDRGPRSGPTRRPRHASVWPHRATALLTSASDASGQPARIAPGVVAVAPDLLDQRLDGVELHLAAEASARSGPWPARRRGRRRSRAGGPRAGWRGPPRRTSAGGRARWPPACTDAVGPLVPAGVDPVGGQEDVAGHRHVGGREARARGRARRRGRRRRAPRGAGRASRWPRSRSPVDERVADGGRRRLRSVAGRRRPGVDERRGPRPRSRGRRPSSAAGRRCPGAGGRSGSPPRRSPTWAPRQSTRTSCTKSSAGSLRAGLVEGDHEAPVDPGGGQQLELLLEVGEQPGRRLGPHDDGRVPVEGDDGARRRPPARRPGAAPRRSRPGGRGARRRRRRW